MFKDVALNWLQKQYGYTSSSDLFIKRAEVWDKYYGNISEIFGQEILNIDTCIPEALDYFWGRLYRITRKFSDNDGNIFVLTDDEFREVIKLRAFGDRWDGTIKQMNEFLINLFKNRGTAYMTDSLNMKYEVFVFNFQLSDNEKFLFLEKDVLPRPAGVGIDIIELDVENTIGFYGTELEPLGQGVLFNGGTAYGQS